MFSVLEFNFRIYNAIITFISNKYGRGLFYRLVIFTKTQKLVFKTLISILLNY